MSHEALVQKYKPALRKILIGFKSGLKFKQLRDVIFVGTKESMPKVELKVGLVFYTDEQPPDLVMVLNYNADMTALRPKDPKAAADFAELWDEVLQLAQSNNGKTGPALLVQGSIDQWSQQFSFNVPVEKS